VQAIGASLPQSAKVSVTSAGESGSALSGDAPLLPQSIRLVAWPTAMDSDEEIMMEVLQEDEAEAAAYQQRWNMGSAFLLQLLQQLNDVVPHRGGSRPDKAVNKNRHRDAGAMLLHSDYFADDASNTPKEFRR
jgi:hypothetical protein